MIQRSPTFVRLPVADAGTVTVVDLVAEPVQSVDPPRRYALGDVEILVDTPFEILVNKLTALLSRSEIRDLSDVNELLKQGLDLGTALAAAPKKDAGFSAMTLAWVLQGLDVAHLGHESGLSSEGTQGLLEFKEELIQTLVARSVPNA